MYKNLYTNTHTHARLSSGGLHISPEFAPLAAAAESHSTRKPRRFACVAAACSTPSSAEPPLELAGARVRDTTTSGCACETLRQYLYFCTCQAAAVLLVKQVKQVRVKA